MNLSLLLILKSNMDFSFYGSDSAKQCTLPSLLYSLLVWCYCNILNYFTLIIITDNDITTQSSQYSANCRIHLCLSVANVISLPGIHLVEGITQFCKLIWFLCSCKRGGIIKTPTISTLKADLSVKHTHNEHIIKVVGISHPREERLENFPHVDVKFAARFLTYCNDQRQTSSTRIIWIYRWPESKWAL